MYTLDLYYQFTLLPVQKIDTNGKPISDMTTNDISSKGYHCLPNFKYGWLMVHFKSVDYC